MITFYRSILRTLKSEIKATDHVRFFRSFASASNSSTFDYKTDIEKVPIEKIRNIGIIAHIDAGKTTTTERMLYYSGLISRIGNVDEGDTITDYLTEEKDRGITIQSAAVTIPWNHHRINIIDTPGHADFTFEVIRSLRVLDGGVTVLDAVAGVEAQTEKVWKQARDLGIPLIAYINKMDRDGAGYGRTVKEIVGRLGTRATLVNIPYFVEDVATGRMNFTGVIDVIHKNLLRWNISTNVSSTSEAADGTDIEVIHLEKEDLNTEYTDAKKQCIKARKAVIEQLCDFDDAIVDSFLETEDYMKVDSAVIQESLRKATIKRYTTPILCGSSFKNIGVQPLMDAVVSYLPSPIDVPPPKIICDINACGRRKRNAKKYLQAHSNETDLNLPVKMDPRIGCVINKDKNLSASLAFKVISHPNRGLMIFVRVYSGKLNPNSTVINSRTGERIRIGKLLLMNGEIPQEVKYLTAGNIGVITGTEEISTGDTLISHAISKNPNKIQKREASAKLLSITIPPPVFSVSIEPTTVADKRKLETCLKLILKEDPSLRLTYDDEAGQLILSGMGELHLEITKDRLVNDMKVNADIGKVHVTYKESIIEPTESVSKSQQDPNCTGMFYVKLTVVPFEGLAESTSLFNNDTNEECHLLKYDNNMVVFEQASAPPFVEKVFSGEYRWPMEVSYDQLINSIISGVNGSLQVGGRIASLPLHSVAVKILKWNVPLEAKSATPLLQLTRMAIKKALASLPEKAFTILEPIMKVSVFVNDQDLGVVTQDLMSARNAQINDIEEQDHSYTGEEALWAREEAEKTYVPFDSTMRYVQSGQSGGKKVIRAEAPLREMIGYLPKLRSLTKGRGIYDMEYKGMERTTPDRTRTILEDDEEW